MNDKETSNLNKKIDKIRTKAEKKADKKAAKKEKKEETPGILLSEIFLVFVILIVWLVIFILIIKMDVGGFGTTVMTPILKDIPYVKTILPN